MRFRDRMALVLVGDGQNAGAMGKQPPSLKMALEKAHRTGRAWTAKISCRDPKGRVMLPVNSMPVADLMELADGDVEGYLRIAYGAGSWAVRLHDHNDIQQSSYSVPVGGAALYNPTKGSQSDGDGSHGGNGSGNLTQRDLIMMLMDDRKADRELLIATLQGGNSGGGIMDDPFVKELLGTLVNNFFVQKENIFETMKQAMEVSQMFHPNISGESDTAALVSAIAPVFTALVAGRSGAPVQQVMPQVTQALGIQTKEQLQSLLSNPQAIQQVLDSLPSASPQAAALPQPGASKAEPPARVQQAAPPPEVQQTTPPESHFAPGSEETDQAGHPPVAGPDPHLALADGMIGQFRRDITNGVPAEKLAATLIATVTYGRSLERPPVVLRGLINSSAEDLESEFNSFCAAVPELANEPERSFELGIALANLLVAEANGTPPADQEAAVDADGRPLYNYNEDQGLQQATVQEQEAVAMEQQAKETAHVPHDRSEPSGIPAGGDGGRTTDDPAKPAEQRDQDSGEVSGQASNAA